MIPTQNNHATGHKSRLLIRADVGPSVGTGHLMRTLALGQAWKQISGEVTVVCGELPRGLSKRIVAEGFDVQTIKNCLCDTVDGEETLSVIKSVGPDWIVLDGYRFDDEYQSQLKTSGAKLLVLDDYQHAQHHSADLILNQNIYAKLEQYDNSDHSKILAGPEFALLREEFSILATKRTATDARRLLVTFGGADPDNWTLKTLQTLSDLKRKRLIVDCVIGACYPHGSELDQFKRTANMNLRIHRNVDRMTTLMTRVDLAITAGGSTCYELARCGIPAVVIAIADNQVPVACAMDEQGAMVSLSGESDARGALGQTINALLKDPDKRSEMSRLGQLLVDGRGVQRIVDRMQLVSVASRMTDQQLEKENAMSEPSELIQFRDATIADAAPILQWRNDPEVRSVSFHNDVIPLDVHQKWMESKLYDARTKIWIAEDNTGHAIGQLRFDLSQSGEEAVISIIVDQTLRGKGLGRRLIANSTAKFFEETQTQIVIAQIKPGNNASERAFRAAGFHAIEPTIVNGKMALQYMLARDESRRQIPLRKSA
ncbi:MAG: UDP-2,4-diacetamido-2,4,6-trideoxy-beta-L-altropyranose hydrolase [Mariniblastus sp.]